MRCILAPVLLALALPLAGAGPKPHLINLGPATTAKLFVGPSEKESLDLKIRPLYVDGKLKDFTTGEPHDVTDRSFVVRRVYRINDLLPEDPKAPPRWKWQRDGWLVVDRSTGHVGPVALPEFDPYYSVASWYRDYVAYCGVSDDGEKLYAMVAQLGRRKPVLKHDLGAAHGRDLPDSECPAPQWQRAPMRVSFQPAGGQKLTFAVRGHSADVAEADDEQK